MMKLFEPMVVLAQESRTGLGANEISILNLKTVSERANSMTRGQLPELISQSSWYIKKKSEIVKEFTSFPCIEKCLVLS